MNQDSGKTVVDFDLSLSANEDSNSQDVITPSVVPHYLDEQVSRVATFSPSLSSSNEDRRTEGRRDDSDRMGQFEPLSRNTADLVSLETASFDNIMMERFLIEEEEVGDRTCHQPAASEMGMPRGLEEPVEIHQAVRFHDSTNISSSISSREAATTKQPNWRRDADMLYRRQMLDRLFDRIRKSKRSPSEKHNLEQKAIKLEECLYMKAPSLQDYLCLWKSRQIKEEAIRIAKLQDIVQKKKRSLEASLNDLPADKRARVLKNIDVVAKVMKSDQHVGCAICEHNEAEWAIIPCGHQCLCFGCSQRFMAMPNQCPICQQSAQGILKINKANAGFPTTLMSV